MEPSYACTSWLGELARELAISECPLALRASLDMQHAKCSHCMLFSKWLHIDIRLLLPSCVQVASAGKKDWHNINSGMNIFEKVCQCLTKSELP